jgi:DNA mismatch endonuclease, patch repair protein
VPSRPLTSADQGRSRNMRAIRRRDTVPEMRIRRLLHAAGMRYRVDHPIRVPGLRLVRPDIVFPRARVAIFIDGCFWHGCPEHGRRPNIANPGYWTPKIEGNVQRDQSHAAALRASGWCVLRFWEHDDAADVARQITAQVQLIRQQSAMHRGDAQPPESRSHGQAGAEPRSPLGDNASGARRSC